MPTKKTAKKAVVKKHASKKARLNSPFSLKDNKYLVIILLICSLIPIAMILQVFFVNFGTIKKNTPDLFVGESLKSFDKNLFINNPNSISLPGFIQVTPKESLAYSNPQTIELWFQYFDYTQNAQYGSIPAPLYGRINSQNGMGDDYLSFTKIENTISVKPKLIYEAQYAILAGKTDLIPGEWYHVAIVISPDKYSMYLNGKLEDERTFDIPQKGTVASMMYIGRSLGTGSGQYSFNGHIEEMRVSNNARYYGEFNPPQSPFESDQYTQALWHFDGDVIDYSVNGNDGTIVGNVEYTITDIPIIETSPTPIPVVCSKGMKYPYYKNIKGVCTQINECGRSTCDPSTSPKPIIKPRPTKMPKVTLNPIIPIPTVSPY